MRIGEVTRITGLPASTIRFYESCGLIAPARRHPNGYRDYPESVVGMLGMVKMGQQLGFTLDDIRAMLPAPGHAEWSPDHLIASMQGKLAEIRALRQRLARTDEHLTGLIAILQNRAENDSCETRRQQLIEQLTQYTLAHADVADLASVVMRAASDGPAGPGAMPPGTANTAA
jgi:DNA-binding transcriptional MerR regulator